MTRLLDAEAAAVTRVRGSQATAADRQLDDSASAESTAARPLSEGAAALIDIALLTVLAASVVAVTAKLTTVRPTLVIAAATVVPGWALLSLLPATDLLTGAALAVAFSVALETAGSLVLGWSHWWHPDFLGALLAAVSAVPLLIRIGRVIRTRQRVNRRLLGGIALGSIVSRTIALVPLACAMVLWSLSLTHIDVSTLGREGLVSALPATWYAALAILILGGAYACWGRPTSGWVMAAYVLGAVIVLFATVPAVADAPRYAWVYKHIGVTSFMQANGGPDPSGDIYNRFPGFFTLAAAASAWMGIGPLAFAGWAEPFFALLGALLVGALALVIRADRRVAAFAALLFTLASWTGQTYFSPQAASFVIALAAILIALRGLPRGAAHPWLPAVVSKIRTWAAAESRPPLWGPRTSAVAIVALNAVAVVTHQLTPYVLLLQVALLVAIGAVRGLWTLLAMAVVTVGYTAANFGYLNSHFGLLTSLDPLSNVQVAGGFGATAHSGVIDAHAGAFVGAFLVILTIGSALWLIRRGQRSITVVPLVLAAAPAGVLFGQRYGGEATIRAFIFSIPWQTALIAAAVLLIRRTAVRVLTTAAICLIVAAGFIPAFFSSDGLNIFPATEVAASSYFYSHASNSSVLVLAAPDFPTNIGARYPQIDASKTPLVSTPEFAHRDLGAADVNAVRSTIFRLGSQDFVVFSTSEYEAAQWAELTPPGALRRLETAIAASPYFRLWYRNRNVRIYELLTGPTSLQPAAGGG